MSNFRAKAAEIREAGEAERGNFTPTGAPKRLYEYWLARTTSEKGRAIRSGNRKENFCHYWRVVAIWAPLMWLWRGVEAAAQNVIVLGILGCALVGAFVWACIAFGSVLTVVLWILAAALATAYAGLGVLCGVALGFNEQERIDNELPTGKFMLIGVLIGFVVVLPAYGITNLIRWWRREMQQHNGKLVVALISLIPIAWIVLVGIFEGWKHAALVAGFLLLGALVAAVLIFLGIKAADWISGKRAIIKRRAEERFEKWLEEQPLPAHVEPRKPGKISKFFKAFFRGIGDFLIFMAQVVRVNKWKVCPIVEIDNEK